MKKNKFEILVFLCGAMSMSLELVAARIFSPYVGSSNLVWTTIIGMILIFMSIGYSIGGKVADKRQDKKVLRVLFYISLFYISILPILELELLEPFASIGLPLPVTGIIMSIFLFGFPSFVFAFVSPFAVKLKQVSSDDNKEKIGEISGRMSSFSTIGSILGTFLTGFFLIPTIGTKGMILLITILIEILIVALEEKNDIKMLLKHIIIIGILVGLFSLGNFLYSVKHPEIIKDVDSEYSRIQVKEIVNINGDKVKFMQVGNEGAESVVYEQTGEIGKYLYYYDLPKYYLNNYNSVLMIGGAAYTYPTYFYEKEENKDIKMDVVEIDKVMTEIAVDDFNLDLSNPSLGVIHQDSRSYMNYTDKKYDTILVDAFKGVSAPFELTTYEACKKMYNILNESGLVITNVVSARNGKDAKFLEHEFATYKAVFDDVKLFKVRPELDDSEKQNFILIGIKGKLNINDANENLYKNLLDTEIFGYTSDKEISTDNLAQIGD